MKGLCAATAAAMISTSWAAGAQEQTLRIQTLYAPASVPGKLVAQFVDDVETMSRGRVKIEMFYLVVDRQSGRDL